MTYTSKHFPFFKASFGEANTFLAEKMAQDDETYWYIHEALGVELDQLENATATELAYYIKLADLHYKRLQNVTASGVNTGLFGK